MHANLFSAALKLLFTDGQLTGIVDFYSFTVLIDKSSPLVFNSELMTYLQTDRCYKLINCLSLDCTKHTLAHFILSDHWPTNVINTPACLSRIYYPGLGA